MPDGRTHSMATILATGLGAGIVAYYGHYDIVIPYAIGGFSGLLLSPDLDVDNGNISKYFIKKSIGGFASDLWKLYWLPYAKIIPHRDWLSHSLIISTLLRVGYLLFPLIILLWYLYGIGFLATIFLSRPFLIALCSLAISDALHCVMDAIF